MLTNITKNGEFPNRLQGIFIKKIKGQNKSRKTVTFSILCGLNEFEMKGETLKNYPIYI